MIVGERCKSMKEKIDEHIAEAQCNIEGWKSEIRVAKRLQDDKYENYCKYMICVWRNTLNKLESKKMEYGF